MTSTRQPQYEETAMLYCDGFSAPEIRHRLRRLLAEQRDVQRVRRYRTETPTMINELPEVGPMEAWVAASNRADPMYQGFFITEQFTAKEKAREVDAEIASLRAELQAEQERSERYRVALKKARLAIHSEYCGNGRHHECCLAVSSALDQKE